MSHLELSSHSPEQTQRLGAHIGELALAGDTFLLVGGLASVVAGALAWLIGDLRGWPSATTAAFFAGAMTSTPAFTELQRAAGTAPALEATYNLSYFVGVIAAVGGVLLIHFLRTKREAEASPTVSLPSETDSLALL